MKKDDSTGIIYRQWDCVCGKAVFLLVHGLGAHSGRWDNFADFFLERGFSSYALELKGFGQTENLKGHIDSFKVYLRDIESLFNIIKKENPGKKIFLLGESVGALISFLFVISTPEAACGLVCISPAIESNLKFPFLDYLRIFSALFYNPKKQFSLLFDAQMCTRDREYQNKMECDEREHRLASARFLLEVLLAQMKIRLLYKRLGVPVLFLMSGNDMLVKSKASIRVFNSLKAQDKTLCEYPDMYHSLSIDLGKETVFGDIFNWVTKRI